MMRTRGSLLAAVLGSLTLFCALPAHSGDKDKDEGVWRKHENLPAVMGADGKMHSAQCSGYPGTDPKFSFWSKKGSSKNLMVFFEGGGACWDSLTCTFPIARGLPVQVPQFFVPQVDATANPANFDGIFKAANKKNPVADWSMVYIPYCTGDLHAGSATRTYFNVGHPVFPLPSTFQIQHRGFDNFMVVLDWIKKNHDKPKELLVAGASAGGYGASVNFPWIADTYPQAKLNVLADASQGVTTPAFDTGTPGRGSWSIQLHSAFGSNATSLAGPELLRVATRAYPKAKVSQYTTALDVVQIQFYGVMKQFYGPGGSCPNPVVDWYQQMSSKALSYAATLPNYRYYIAAGSVHTILRSPSFYTETSGGISFTEWLDDMLDNRGGRHGHGGGDWRNVACPTCLIQLPCP